MKVDQFI